MKFEGRSSNFDDLILILLCVFIAKKFYEMKKDELSNGN